MKKTVETVRFDPGSFTSFELAERLSISQAGASYLLRGLLKLGQVKRSREGRKFRYALCPSAPAMVEYNKLYAQEAD